MGSIQELRATVSRRFGITLPLPLKKGFFQGSLLLKSALPFRAEAVPLIVIASQRSGSNLLIDLLNSCRSISMSGEIFWPGVSVGLMSWQKNPASAMQHLHRLIGSGTAKIAGAKIFMAHLRNLGMELDQLLSSLPRPVCIYLYRQDTFAQYVSLMEARTSGVFREYRRKTTPAVRKKITVDWEKYLHYAQQRRSELDQMLAMKNCRMLYLTYERLIRDPQSVFNEFIFPGLELPATRVTSSLARQGVSSIESRVENFQELKDRLGSGEHILPEHLGWADEVIRRQ